MKDTSGPAFPMDYAKDSYPEAGMTLRQYAAINLKQPDSGIDWLDEMILRAKRDEFAAQAMDGLLASNRAVSIDRGPHECIAIAAYAQADAMIAESNKGAGDE